MITKVRRAWKDIVIKIFSESLKDIKKALWKKVVMDPRIKLPKYLYEFLEAFSKAKADELLLFRSDIDIQVELEKDEYGKEK